MSCSVQVAAIHFIHCRWQNMANLISWVSVTVLQQLQHVVHIAGARVSCAYHWVTSSRCVMRTEYRQTFCRCNMPAKNTIQNFTQKLGKTSSVLVEHVEHHWQMPEAMTAGVSTRMSQSTKQSLQRQSHEYGYLYPTRQMPAKKAKLHPYGLPAVHQLFEPDIHKPVCFG